MLKWRKSIFIALFVAAVTVFGIEISRAKSGTDSSSLYRNLPFPMARVQTPSIPNRSVNITEFGAISGGAVSNTKMIAAAIDAVVKKGEGPSSFRKACG